MRTLLIALVLMAYAGEELFAAQANIVNIQIKEKYSRLLVSVKLKGAFTDEIKEAFTSGMPVTFTYLVNLNRNRSLMWDASEKKIKIHKIVKYDSFAKEFKAMEMIAKNPPKPEDFEEIFHKIKESNTAKLTSMISESENENWSRYLIIKDITTLEKWMSSLTDIPIGSKIDYPLNRKYYVEVKAEMDTIKLKPPFNYIFFFVSFMNFDTAWETSSPFIIEKADMPIQKMVGQKN